MAAPSEDTSIVLSWLEKRGVDPMNFKGEALTFKVLKGEALTFKILKGEGLTFKVQLLVYPRPRL